MLGDSGYVWRRRVDCISRGLCQEWEETDLLKAYLQRRVSLTSGLLHFPEELHASAGVSGRVVIYRNRIDRVTQATPPGGDLYVQERQFMGSGVHLSFLLKTVDVDYFRPVLAYLQDSGIGGDRRTGQGHFDIKLENKGIELPDAGGTSFVTLSCYLPSTGEVNWEKGCRYSLLPYRSKVESEREFAGQDIWKQRVMYLEELNSLIPASVCLGERGPLLLCPVNSPTEHP